MNKITRFSQLHLPGVLRNFTWPTNLPDFGSCNLVYGWNGTGKTSLSRVLRALELQTALQAGQAELRIGPHDVKDEDFATSRTPIRVFNRDFVNEAVFPSGGGDVPPIFVLGKESAETQKEVDRLKTQLSKTEGEHTDALTKKQEVERALDKFNKDCAKLIKNTLRSSGQNPYNNYDKRTFRTRAEQMAADGDLIKHQVSDLEHQKLLAQHLASPKPRLSELAYQLPVLDQITDDISKLLSSTVVSRMIENLKADNELAEWTRTGLRLHTDRHTDRCFFCEQPLPTDRLTVLEAHFSADYEEFINNIDAKIRELQAAATKAVELKLPNKAELYEELGTEYERAEQSLRGAVKIVRDFFDALGKELDKKKGRQFESLHLSVNVPSIENEPVAGLNSIIHKHNETCDEFESHVSDARDRLALGMIASELGDFIELRNAVQQDGGEVTKAIQEVQRLRGEIERLERAIVEHRQPAEELNNDLWKYLGHDELQLEIKETGYAITRNGIPAESLSEGETTAIALLYFLKSLRDRRFNLSTGIVVLDDPVSSLDANALYLAFGFIRERTQDAGQLFIFTHNFTFFRQIRNWFHHLKGQNKRDVSKRPARFYMLECTSSVAQRHSAIAPLDPLLEQYESEYHYLFTRIYREASAPSSAGLEENYFLPNMARRILEAFLAFRQPQISGDLWQKLKNIEFDQAKKHRILRFVHTYSHCNIIGEPEHDPSLLGEARSVLKDLLEFIKSQDAQHFAAMEELAKPPEEQGGSA